MKKFFKSRWGFLRAVVRDGRPLWWWIAVASVLFLVPYFLTGRIFTESGNLPERVRWIGMLFQFAGLATVIHGLNQSRRLFGAVPVWRGVGAWLYRWWYVIKPLPPINATVNATVGLDGVSATGHVGDIKPSSLTTEERLNRLEAAQERTSAEMQHLRGEMASTEQRMSASIDTERNARSDADQHLSRQLQEAIIGGIHLEISGVIYLLIGIAFTSVPEAIASFLTRVGM